MERFPAGVLCREREVISRIFLNVRRKGVFGMTVISLSLRVDSVAGEYCIVGVRSGGFAGVFPGSWADATLPVKR